MDIFIGKAEDIPQLEPVVQRFIEEGGYAGEWSVGEAMSWLTEQVAADGSFLWYLTEEKEPVAYLFCWVDEAERGMHIAQCASLRPGGGSFLYQTAQAHARLTGCDKITFHTRRDPRVMARWAGAKLVGYLLERRLE